MTPVGARSKGISATEAKKPPVSGRLGEERVAYLAMWYVRSPASFLVLSTVRPIFLVKLPEMKPRMLWFCQSVALAISAIVAPSLRRRRSRTMAFLLNSRGTAASLMGLASFFAAARLASLLAAGLLAF